MSFRKSPLAKRYILAAALIVPTIGTTMPILGWEIVYDPTAVGKLLDQIQKMEQQVTALKSQLTQLENLNSSLSKLTSMADIGSILNDPTVRRALPAEFSQIEGLLKGKGGSLQSLFNKHQQGNSYYQSDANSFYAQEISRLSNEQAGAETVGEQMYQAAAKRIDGIDTLRRQIANAKDPKDSLDLIARLGAEQSFLQVDVLRMQALTMVQRARADVAQRRQEEARLKFQDEVGERIQAR